MKIATHMILDLFGTKKRLGSVKDIIDSLECQYKIKHTSLSSTYNCVIFTYKWGHILIYTYPKSSMIGVDLFSTLCSIKVHSLKTSLIGVFQPSRYEEHEMTRMVGDA